MNKRLIASILLAAVLLVVSSFPAAAEAQKIQVSGTCELLYFVWDANPDFRFWSKPDGMEHWRNSLIMFYCEFEGDDRLDGFYFASDNWNTNPNEKSQFNARNFGGGYISDESGNDLGLWQWSGTSSYDANWTFHLSMTLKGRGIHRGLLAKLEMTAGDWPYYIVQGELFEPSN